MKLPTLTFNPLAILIALTLFMFLPIIFAFYAIEAWGGGGRGVLSLIANILIVVLVVALSIVIWFIRHKAKPIGLGSGQTITVKSEAPTRRGRLMIAWFVTLFMILGGLNGLRIDNVGLETVDIGWMLTMFTPIIIIWTLYFAFKPKGEHISTKNGS